MVKTVAYAGALHYIGFTKINCMVKTCLMKFFSHLGAGLPGLNQYYVFFFKDRTVFPVRLKPASCNPLIMCQALYHCSPQMPYIKHS